MTIYLKHYVDVRCFLTILRRDTYVQALIELLLLLVYYTQAEVDLVGLFESRFHAHDLRKCFFGVLQRSVAIIEYTNAVPKLGLLTKRQSLSMAGMSGHIPLGQTSGIALADRRSKPAASRPSSDNNALVLLVELLEDARNSSYQGCPKHHRCSRRPLG